MALVEAHGLVKTYTMGDQVIRALDGVSFTIDPGEYLAIIGPSGSGKSTLMNVMGGLDTPGDGRLRIADAELSELDDAALAAFRNQTIGFVFQSFNLLPRLTALENVELPMIYAGTPSRARRARAAELLARVGLGQRTDHKPTQLSGGQQQRVAIARALANDPAILLADEPTGALDTATTTEILGLFSALNREGATVILVTHEMEVADQARRVIEMRDGKIRHDRRKAAA